MALITPTITTADPHEYREQMELISAFSEGVHLDFADGILAPTELLPIDQAWRRDDLITHAHVMYKNPVKIVDHIIKLQADLVVLHVESENLKSALETLQESGTRTGIALLPETSIENLKELGVEGLYDHVLVFGGHLGFQGGDADLDQLKKVKLLKQEYPDMEISWDGGVSDKNAKQIADAGVDILNTGGFIKNAEDPRNAYDTLSSLIQS